jgi:drug/metabolite transporter (DMT)-like permease
MMATKTSSHANASHVTTTRSQNLTGALWLILSGVAFTVFLVLAKQLSSSQSPAVLAFWRSFVGLLVVLPIIFQRGWDIVRITRPGLVISRSLVGTLAFIFSMYAISDAFALPLSQFNAISFSRALFVTLLAAWLLGESVGKWRWGALLIGFFGVLIMVMPDLILPWYESDEGADSLVIDAGTLFALLSALGFAGAIVMVKSLTATHTPMTLLIWANFLSTLLLAPFLLFQFATPIGMEWVWLIGMALAGVLGQYCYINAMSVGDASFLAPVDYLRLPMAALADFLIFKMLPGHPVWIGTAIIICATLFMAYREHKKRAHAQSHVP